MLSNQFDRFNEVVWFQVCLLCSFLLVGHFRDAATVIFHMYHFFPCINTILLFYVNVFVSSIQILIKLGHICITGGVKYHEMQRKLQKNYLGCEAFHHQIQKTLTFLRFHSIIWLLISFRLGESITYERCRRLLSCSWQSNWGVSSSAALSPLHFISHFISL